MFGRKPAKNSVYSHSNRSLERGEPRLRIHSDDHQRYGHASYGGSSPYSQSPSYQPHTSYVEDRPYTVQEYPPQQNYRAPIYEENGNYGRNFFQTHSPRNYPVPVHGPSYGQQHSYEEEFWGHGEDFPHQGERASPVRFLLTIFGIVITLIMLWFSYHWITQTGGDAPVHITAEQGPVRIAPAHPGGMEIPHQDRLVYGNLDLPVEKLVPPPYHGAVRQPSHPAYAPAQSYQQVQPSSPQQQPMNVPQSMEPHPHHMSAVPSQPVYVQHQVPPHQQAPVNYGNLPPQQPYAVPPQQHYVAPGAPVYTAVAGSAAVVAPAAYATQETPSYQPSNPQQPAEPVNPQTEIAVQKEGEVPIGSFFVQFATLPTEEKAKVEMDRLERKLKRQLSHKLSIRRIGEGPSARVVAGPFNNKDEATTECLKIGNGCRVTQ